MKTTATGYLEVVEAKYVSGYKHSSCDSTTARHALLTCENFLRRAQNPDITRYRQLRKFKSFHLHYGNLMWGDHDMIFRARRFAFG